MVVIEFLYSIIGTPLGYIMWAFYALIQNFGLAIIIFTLVIKAALFPITLKQQKNMAVSQLFTPRVKEIQAKYKSNPQKQQEEMQKLQKEGYNPMGGCLPMVITLVILFGVIDVVYKPMTHMEHMDWTQSGVTSIIETTAKQTDYAAIVLSSEEDKKIILDYKEDPNSVFITTENAVRVDLPEGYKLAEHAPEASTITGDTVTELGIDKWTDDIVATLAGDTSRLSDEVRAALNQKKTLHASLQRELVAVQSYSKYPDTFKANAAISGDSLQKLDNLSKNMIFLGIDLGEMPTFEFNSLLIIPIIAFLFSIAQTLLSQWVQKKTNPDMAQMGGGMKLFIYIMPLFSLWISFSVPAGVGFYWAISYLFGIAQSLIIYKFWPPEKMREQAKVKFEQKYGKVSATATIVDVDDDGKEVKRVEKIDNLSAKEQKEYYRKKIEEARRADAEKYGEDYIDDGDGEKKE